MEEILDVELAKQFHGLMKEFRGSGIGIDEFLCKKLLSNHKKGGKEFAAKMIDTFRRIDDKYAARRKANTEREQNCRDWMCEQIDNIIAKNKWNGKRDVIGRVVNMSTEAFKGNSNPLVDDSSPALEGSDAIEAMGKLVEAMETSTANDAELAVD